MDALTEELKTLLRQTKAVHDDVVKSRKTALDGVSEASCTLIRTIRELTSKLTNDIENSHQQSIGVLMEFMDSTAELINSIGSCDDADDLLELQQKASTLKFPVMKTVSFVSDDVSHIGVVVREKHPSNDNINLHLEEVSNLINNAVEKSRSVTTAPNVKAVEEDEMVKSARNAWMCSMRSSDQADDLSRVTSTTRPSDTNIAFKSKQIMLRFPTRKLPTRLPHTATSSALPTPLQSTLPTPHRSPQHSPSLTPPLHSPVNSPLDAPLIDMKSKPLIPINKTEPLTSIKTEDSFVPMNKEQPMITNDNDSTSSSLLADNVRIKNEPLDVLDGNMDSKSQNQNGVPDWPDDDKENGRPNSMDKISDGLTNLRVEDLPLCVSSSSSVKNTPNRPTTSALSKLLQNRDIKNFNVSLKTVLRGEQYGFQFPIGVQVYKDGLVVCNSGSNSVMYIQMDNEHNVLGKIYLQGTYKRPSAATVLDGFLFVKDDVSIKKYDDDLRLIMEFKENLGRPYGLSVYKSMLITMTDCGMGRTAPSKPTLLLYDVDGKFVKHRYLDIPTTLRTKLRFMDVFGDKIYISDLGASHVFCVNVESGKLTSIIGKPGNKLGEFNEPSGITCDNNGNILIADSRANRILVYDNNGTCRSTLTCEGSLNRPSGILVSNNDILFTVNYLGGFSIKIYDLQQATTE